MPCVEISAPLTLMWLFGRLFMDIIVSVTVLARVYLFISYVLQSWPIIGFRVYLLPTRVPDYKLILIFHNIIASLILATLKATFLLAVLAIAIHRYAFRPPTTHHLLDDAT